MRRLLPLVLLAHAWLLLLPGGVNVCVHTDGSWRLESAAFPCCAGGDANEKHAQRHGPEAAQDGCEDCTDYPVPTLKDAAVARSAGGVAPIHSASIVTLDMPTLAVAIAREPWDLRGHPPRRRPPPDPRTTTILRC